MTLVWVTQPAITRVPRAAIVARSAWTFPGLTRRGLLHFRPTVSLLARWTKTPMRGPWFVAQAPFGGGQSLAQADNTKAEEEASALPGVQLKGAAAVRGSLQVAPAEADVVPSETTSAATIAGAAPYRRARGKIIAGILDHGGWLG